MRARLTLIVNAHTYTRSIRRRRRRFKVGRVLVLNDLRRRRRTLNVGGLLVLKDRPAVPDRPLEPLIMPVQSYVLPSKNFTVSIPV
jgi:hypothetical protein